MSSNWLAALCVFVGLLMTDTITVDGYKLTLDATPLIQPFEGWVPFNGQKAPLPTKGLYVWIVYETSKVQDLPKSQLTALQSTQLIAYLAKHAAKDDDGVPAFRKFDPQTDVTNEPQVWKDALALSKDKPLPFIGISNGDTNRGFLGPLPATEADLLSLVKTYGG